MRGAIYLLVFAGLLLAGIRFLIRASADRENDNSVHRGAKGFSPLDASAGAYDRQGTEMSRDLDAETTPPPDLARRRDNGIRPS